MADTKPIPVRDLRIDLRNFRTIEQPDERSAIEAMISTSPDRFWALAESLIDDGYLPTESVIVLRGEDGELVVKEGNRRVAALKLIHGLEPHSGLEVPEAFAERLGSLEGAWRRENSAVPCTVYGPADAGTVDRIVALAHGKGEKAGRDQWNAVARARHSREGGAAEPALDLLEKYLAEGRNLTPQQRARWSGAFPLSVLEEAAKRVATAVGLANAADLAAQYPTVRHRGAVERVMRAIGSGQLGFAGVRNAGFRAAHGFPAAAPAPGAAPGAPSQPGPGKAARVGGAAAQPRAATTRALPTSDPLAVRRQMRQLALHGSGREKLASLQAEAAKLDISSTPLAFCFLLRSMFELSARAYCADHAPSGGPTTKKTDGRDKDLAALLLEIVQHMKKVDPDPAKTKALHGAITELAKKEGILSVTSMNQLVHNPNFSVAPADLGAVIANVLPLLREMSA